MVLQSRREYLATNCELVINDLYIHEWSHFTNYFCPTLKLKEKQRINSRYVKRYEQPQTPCQRLMDSIDVSREAKRTPVAVYNSLNPFKRSMTSSKLFLTSSGYLIPYTYFSRSSVTFSRE